MHVYESMEHLIRIRDTTPLIRKSVNGNFETCGSIENGKLTISNVSKPGVFKLNCETYLSPTIVNYHSHPKEEYPFYWSGFPSNTDFKSLFSISKQFKIKASDNILCNKGVFYYATTDKLVQLVDIHSEDNLIDVIINPNRINDKINGQGTLEEIVTKFIAEASVGGWFECKCIIG